MKDIILTLIATLTLFFSGCAPFLYSHNVKMAAHGKVFRIGGEGASIMYVNGTVLITGARENDEDKVKVANKDGLAGAPTADLSTELTIQFGTGPQITGYLADLAKVDTNAATAYVTQMGKLNKARWSDTTEATTIKSGGEKTSTSDYISYLKEKLKGIAGNKETKATITGDGEYKELYKDATIEAQAALTAELLKYADNETLIQKDGETIRDTLVHYAGRLAQLKAKGKSESKRILLDRCTVKDGKVTFLRYRLTDLQSGESSDEVCPSCYGVED